MPYPYRCTREKCKARVVLGKPSYDYACEPVCRHCGSRLRSTRREISNKTQKHLCRCDGYHYPHMAGSKWCESSTVELTEQDYLERS